MPLSTSRHRSPHDHPSGLYGERSLFTYAHRQVVIHERRKLARHIIVRLSAVLLVSALVLSALDVHRAPFGCCSKQRCVERDFAQLQSALELLIIQTKIPPSNLDALRERGLLKHPAIDPWGTPYVLRTTADLAELRSAGPDGVFYTMDDRHRLVMLPTQKRTSSPTTHSRVSAGVSITASTNSPSPSTGHPPQGSPQGSSTAAEMITPSRTP